MTVGGFRIVKLTVAAPSVNVVGSDTGAAPGMLVRDATFGLRGRPDYVLEYGAPNERRLYPIEVKQLGAVTVCTGATSCRSAPTSSRFAGPLARAPGRPATFATLPGRFVST